MAWQLRPASPQNEPEHICSNNPQRSVKAMAAIWSFYFVEEASSAGGVRFVGRSTPSGQRTKSLDRFAP